MTAVYFVYGLAFFSCGLILGTADAALRIAEIRGALESGDLSLVQGVRRASSPRARAG
jgi:hypothetical protein